MQSETLKKTKAAKFFAAVLTAVVLASAAAAIPVCAVLTAGEARPVIVVDAGHGGLDGGVVGTRTGVKESDLNLAVALLLGGMLEEDGFDVVFTRAGKGGLYLDGERGKKSADMRRRADIIARSGAVGVVSIHMNTFSDSSRRGAQVFFDASSSRGRALADAVQTELNRSFNLPDAGRGSRRLPPTNSSCNRPPPPPSSWNAAFSPTPTTKEIFPTRATAPVSPSLSRA